MANLILSAFSDEYHDNFEEQLKAMNSFDIKYIELRFVDGKNVSDLSKEEVARVKSMISEYGVKISSIGSPLGKIRLDEDMDAHFEKAKRILEIANELDTGLVRMFSFYLPDGKTREECRDNVLENLDKMITVADTAGITLCHENEAKIYGESPEYCYDILSHFDGRLRAVFDMGNFVLDNYNPYPEAYQLLLPYIEYFHIKDSLYKGAIVPAGKGEAQIKEILDDFKKNGKKDAFITLEPHLETFSGLHTLVGKKFENPYKFENSQVSFKVAVESLRELL